MAHKTSQSDKEHMKQSTSFAQVATNLLNVLQGYTKGIRFVAVLTVLLSLGIGQAWGETIVSWSGAKREANTKYDPTTSQTDNSTAKLKSECTLSTAGSGGSAGSYYGAWTNDKCIYVTGLNLSNYKDISLTVYLRRRNGTCTASFYTSTDGSTYAATALDTKTLTNTLTSYKITGISSNVKAIKIFITGGGGNLWLGTLSVEGTKAAAVPIDVTLHYKGTSTTISNQTSPYTLPTIGDYAENACDGWEFAGWYDSEYAKSEIEPTYITQLTSTGNAYAVYSHTAEGGGGSSTATMSSFSAVSGNVNNDANVSYEAAKGTASTAPGVYSNVLRIYQNGGTLTITGNNEKKLTSITIGSSMATSVSYKIDGGTESSNQSIAANGKFTLSEIEASSVLFTCKGTTSSSRLYLNYLSVTYSGGNTVYYTTSPSCATETSH